MNNNINFLLDNPESIPESIGIAGDWHGNLGWALKAINEFHNRGIRHIFHLGDFCIMGGPDGMKFTRRINMLLEKLDMYIYVTLGNHENYNLYEKHYVMHDNNGISFKNGEPRILVFPRGYHWSWHDISYMSFGGANSIDKAYRHKNSWWEQEQITDEQIMESIGHPVDVMFTHDVPYGVEMFKNHRDASNGWSKEDLEYASHSSHQLRRLTDIVRPSLMFHGHYHKWLNHSSRLYVDDYHKDRKLITDDLKYKFSKRKDYLLQSVCLDKEYSNSNMVIYTPETMEYHILSSW